jgi:hypothetical protein
VALSKQPVNINFSQGLDTKSDPKQVQIGKFLSLQNTVFDKAGALVKRNGYPTITELPNAEQTTITTLNDNLLATGSHLYAFSEDVNQWLDQGIVQPVQLNTQALVRSSTAQVSPDMAIAASGLACLVYMDSGSSYYQISDSHTGQQIVPRQSLPATATNPRVFLLDKYFIVTFIANVSGLPHLQYIYIPIAVPASPSTAQDISATVFSLTTGYDAYVANNALYFAWRATGVTLRLALLSSTLIVSAPTTIVAQAASLISVTAQIDLTDNIIWVSWWNSATNDTYTAAYTNSSNFLVQTLAPTLINAGQVLNELTSISVNGVLTVFYENNNTYSYSPNAKTDYISKRTVTSLGVVSSATIILRSVGLASKPILDASGVIYVMATYGEINQPTYFLIDSDGNIYMRLAYSNGGGYQPSQILPTISVVGTTYYVPYMIKDFLTTINKGTNLPAGTPANAIYTQTGINLAIFSVNNHVQYSSEIANALHLTGGQLWEYDGVRPVEHGFHVWPENMAVTTATGAGNIAAGTYYYIFCYEWTDNQGNLHRSAPSIPITQVTTTVSSTNTINVPTLRLTYKRSPNPVRIVGYRWSVAQQTYYQFTSVTSPVLNDPTIDSVTIVDTLSDLQILGQTLLYTTGGVVENIAAPASIDSALFKNRLFLIDAEDRNLLWFSKQVIQNTPVEMSDLFTIYVAPTSGAQGSTGPMTAIGAMDDKLIIFKEDAIYYLTGTGPDNTGAQNDFSDPTFITSAVGCSTPSSIVLMPNGLMFQSNKGIWLLGRDLSTTYIGAPVEQYNNNTAVSAHAIPGTNQVRFVLDNNITLMYDYYYGQWGTFNNTFAISATLFNGAHTYLNSYGQVFKETPNTYIDGSEPVLLSFTTGWINIAGVQGYERFYEMLVEGTYYSPFKLYVQLAYDYNPSASQATTILPDNYTPKWGGEAQWGSGGPWGGIGNVLEARLFPERQKCEAFQITVNEVYDSSFSVPAAQGLSLSGLNLLLGIKKGTRTSKASQSFG